MMDGCGGRSYAGLIEPVGGGDSVHNIIEQTLFSSSKLNENFFILTCY